jgi:SAM-dependent methyltransferase
VGVRLNGSKGEFDAFLDGYRALIKKYIPFHVDFEYVSPLYMDAVHTHLEHVLSRLSKGAKVVDMGCGRGHFSAYLASRGLKMSAIEIKTPRLRDDFLHQQSPEVLGKYPALLRESSKKFGYSFTYYNGRDFPFKDASQDAVMFYATYEHVPVADIRRVTEEAVRVLKPGGKVFIYRCPSTWAWKERFTHLVFNQGHEKLYGKGEILSLLGRAGLVLDHFDRSDFFPAYSPSFQNILNALTPFFVAAEAVLKYTPLRFFFHHFESEAHKPLAAKGNA